MGTIRDAHGWLKDTLGGDAPRANSLLKVGQTERLLTSWGRKPVSPPLVLTDFSAVLCMALMTEGPTKAPQVVSRLWKLPLSLLTVDPGDGVARDLDPEHLADAPDLLTKFLKPYFGEEAVRNLYPTNLIGRLTSLYERFAPQHDFHVYDTLKMEQAGDRLSVKLSLHGPRHGVQVDGYRGEGDDAFQLVLTFGDLIVFSGRAVETGRTLPAGALNALAALNRDEWAMKRVALREAGEAD